MDWCARLKFKGCGIFLCLPLVEFIGTVSYLGWLILHSLVYWFLLSRAEQSHTQVKKMLGLKNFGSTIFLVTTNSMVWKYVGPKQMLVLNKLGPKTIWVLKIFGSNIFFGSNKVLGPKIGVQTNLDPKNCVPKILSLKIFLCAKNFGSQKMLVQRKYGFRSEIFLCPKESWVQKNFASKNILTKNVGQKNDHPVPCYWITLYPEASDHTVTC